MAKRQYWASRPDLRSARRDAPATFLPELFHKSSCAAVYIAEPVPALAANVRHSQPYGVVADDYLYVVDGGYNKVFKAEIISGAFATLVSFPNIPNPMFGTLGGPTMEVVPTSIN